MIGLSSNYNIEHASFLTFSFGLEMMRRFRFLGTHWNDHSIIRILEFERPWIMDGMHRSHVVDIRRWAQRQKLIVSIGFEKWEISNPIN
jgi:hypothetical protein